MTRDLVMTTSSGYTFNQLRYWLNSLDRSGFDGDRVVILGRDDRALADVLQRRGCQVVSRDELIAGEPARRPFADADMCVERFMLFWKYLSSVEARDFRYVIAVDVRDAVFQLNPSDWLSRHMGHRRFVVASEGITYGDQPWNRDNMIEIFGPAVFLQMRTRLVWNCGTVAGETSLFRDLSLLLYRCCSGMVYSDQAALNVLLSLEPYSALTLFDEGSLGWACQAGTMTGQARGSELSYCYRGREPLFDGTAVYTRSGVPFCIVHQYDRVPSWRVALERRFGD